MCHSICKHWKNFSRHAKTSVSHKRKLEELQQEEPLPQNDETVAAFDDTDDFPQDETSAMDDVSDVEMNNNGASSKNQPNNNPKSWIEAVRDDPSLMQNKTADTLDDIIAGGNFDTESRSPEFYSFEQQHPGQGSKYLTAKAFGVQPCDVSTEEANFSLKITKLLTELTKTQQHCLAECLLQAANSKDKSLSIFNHTRVPTSVDDFNDFYLSGPNSVNMNLPHPVIKKTPDGNHAYVTLMEVIAHMCASATEVDKFHFETDLYPGGLHSEAFDGTEQATISTTRAAYSLFFELKKSSNEEGFVLYLWIKTWRDDFDPNNTKSSRNQVWLMTNTICAPPTEKKGCNTFFMAIGQKGDDHQQIEEVFSNEMACLSQGKTFYHGALRKIITVKAGLVSICVDHPERTAIFQIGDHNGSYSVYFGHATKVDGKCEDNCLPSCPFCHHQRLDQHLE